jgi:hypothetical protein
MGLQKKKSFSRILILIKDEVYIDQSGNVYIDQSGNTKLVFKVLNYQDIYRLYNEDIIFLKENYRRYRIVCRPLMGISYGKIYFTR